MKKLILLSFSTLLISKITFAQSIEEGIKALENERTTYAANVFKKYSTNNPEAAFYLTSIYIEKNYLDSAKKTVDAAMANPSPIAYITLAKYQLATKDITNAKANTDKAVALSKEKDSKVLNFAAETWISLETKDTKKALELLNKSLMVDKKNPQTYMLLGDTYLADGQGGPAINNYEKALEINNKNPKGYLKIGEVYSLAKNYQLAIDNLNKALELDANCAPAYRALGEVYSKQKKFDMASKNYEKYLQIAERNNETLSKYAKSLFQANDYLKTIAACNEALKEDANNNVMYRLIGYSYAKLLNETNDETTKKQYTEEGLKAMNKFLENASKQNNKPLSSDYETLGKFYFKLGNDSLAIENLNKAVLMDDKNAEAYNLLGETYMHAKNYSKAAEAFKNKINNSKNNSALDYFNLGKAHYYNKNLLEADTAFAMVIQLKPTLSTGYFWRAKANYTEKTPEAPKPFFEKYIELVLNEKNQPKKDLIEAYNYLGTYWVQKEDNAKAKEYFNKIIELDPENKTAKEALKALGK